jgi:hypothetical protein
MTDCPLQYVNHVIVSLKQRAQVDLSHFYQFEKGVCPMTSEAGDELPSAQPWVESTADGLFTDSHRELNEFLLGKRSLVIPPVRMNDRLPVGNTRILSIRSIRAAKNCSRSAGYAEKHLVI